jgi:trans-2,3-dihydro-3-hydroxyanthranilate isomerase
LFRTMKKYQFMQVDVFAQVALEGNPCAVVFDADDLSDKTMLAIAREMNLSETAFVKKSPIADFRVQYFTPREEIPLAGHPTVGTIHALVETGRIKVNSEPVSVSLELTAGTIRVDVEPIDKGFLVTMYQLKPEFLRIYPPKEVMPLFGLNENDWHEGAPIQTVSTGTPMLMVPIVTLDALKRAELSVSAYAKYKGLGDFFCPHLFCLKGLTAQGDTFARNLGLPPDTYEDPFTGSASGSMLAYLWHHRLINKKRIIAQQGHWMQRPGEAQLEVVGEPDCIETVKLIGGAITVINGELTI